MNPRSLSLAVLLTALVANPPVLAHTAEYFDSIATEHGGQMRMAGPYHLELLVEGQAVSVYVSDHANNPQSTAELTARVIVLDGAQRGSIELAPAGDNRLTGELAFAPSAELIAVVTVSGEDGNHQARFKPLAAGEPSAADAPPPATGHGEHAQH